MNNAAYRRKITETAIELLNTKDCKDVTMDLLAGTLHISKRTLYEVFNNKEELVFGCLTEVQHRINEHRTALCSSEKDPIKLLLNLLKSTYLMNNQYAMLILNAKHQYPELYEKIQHLYDERFYTTLTTTMHKLSDNGDLNDSTDIEMSAKTLICTMNHSMEISMSKNVEISKLTRNGIYLYTRGMLSTKAIKRYDKNEEEFRNLLGYDED